MRWIHIGYFVRCTHQTKTTMQRSPHTSNLSDEYIRQSGRLQISVYMTGLFYIPVYTEDEIHTVFCLMLKSYTHGPWTMWRIPTTIFIPMYIRQTGGAIGHKFCAGCICFIYQAKNKLIGILK